MASDIAMRLTGATAVERKSKWKGYATRLVVGTSTPLFISGGTGKSFAPSDVSGTACVRLYFVAIGCRAMLTPIIRLFGEL